MTMRKAPCSVGGCERQVVALGLCNAHHKRQKDGRPLDTPIFRRGPRRQPTLAEKLAAGTTVSEGCWTWAKGTDDFGYGKIHFDGWQQLTHRVAYELAFGEIPQGLYVLHRCDNPPCVRPDHLFLGTHLDNVADMVAKGRNRTSPLRGEDAPHAKLTWAIVAEIRASTEQGIVLAARYGVSNVMISRIRLGKAWKLSDSTQMTPAQAQRRREAIERIEARLQAAKASAAAALAAAPRKLEVVG